MDAWFFIAALLLFGLLVLPIVIGIARGTTLFVLRARAGKLELVRGRLPQALFDDLDDVARRERLHGVEVRAVVEGGEPRLTIKGSVSPGVEQSLRNVLGRFRLMQIRTGNLRAR